MLDITVHDADTLRFVLDDEPGRGDALAQSAGMARQDLEDGVMAVFRFRSGPDRADSTTPSRRNTRAPASRSTAREGSLIGRDVMTQHAVGEVTLRNGEGERRSAVADTTNLYVRALRAFHAAIRGEGQPAATGEDGVSLARGGGSPPEEARRDRPRGHDRSRLVRR